MPKTAQPQNSVDASEYRPIVEVASVRGSSTSMNGAGVETITSSVPCQRCHCRAPPEPKSVADQIP